MGITPVYNRDLLAFISRSREQGVTKRMISDEGLAGFSLDSDLEILIKMNEICLGEDERYRLIQYS